MQSYGALPRNSVIVVAHPDDEVLWFNSILQRAERVFIVFQDFWAMPDLGAARAAALRAHPHPAVTCLGLQESGAFDCADWGAPLPNAVGLQFSPKRMLRQRVWRAKRMAVESLKQRKLTSLPDISALYAQNYDKIKVFLKEALSRDMNVFTHNPWGEYGHEEHVQIFRVLRALQDEIEFGLWVPNYCSDRALPLATRYFSREATDYIRFATDKDYATKLAELYIQEGCWTWADAWAWFDEECFIEASSLTPGEAAYSHLFPLNLFKFGAASGGKY